MDVSPPAMASPHYPSLGPETVEANKDGGVANLIVRLTNHRDSPSEESILHHACQDSDKSG